MNHVTIILDDVQARAWLERLAHRAGDLSDLMMDIGELLRDSTQGRFRSGIAPDGKPWKPLADGSGRVPLTDTGRMRGDISTSTGRDFVEIVASAKQARWHQEGTSPYTIRPKGKRALSWVGGPGPRKKVDHPGLVARPFIGLSRDDEAGIGRLTVAWIEES